MEKHFATYEQALALRKLGFNELCTAWYSDKRKLVYCQLHLLKRNSEIDTKPGTYIGDLGCYVPLKSQVFEWFREKYSIVGYVVPHNGKWTYKIISNKINIELNGFKTYVDAESACIDKLIELVKKK